MAWCGVLLWRKHGRAEAREVQLSNCQQGHYKATRELVMRMNQSQNLEVRTLFRSKPYSETIVSFGVFSKISKADMS